MGATNNTISDWEWWQQDWYIEVVKPEAGGVWDHAVIGEAGWQEGRLPGERDKGRGRGEAGMRGGKR